MSSDGRARALSGNAGEEVFGYSQAVRTGTIIEVSGQVGRDNASGELVGETTLSRRLGTALSNVRKQISELGGPDAGIVSLQLHLAEGRCHELATIADRVAQITAGQAPPPTVTLVPVSTLFSPDYLVEVSAMASTQPRTAVPDAGPVGTALGSSRAVRVGDEIVLAGHLSTGADGAPAGATRAEQLEGIFTALRATLAECGAALEDVTSTHTWVLAGASTEEMEAFHAVHSTHFAPIKPAATLLFVPELPLGALVQMSATARLAPAPE